MKRRFLAALLSCALLAHISSSACADDVLLDDIPDSDTAVFEEDTDNNDAQDPDSM